MHRLPVVPRWLRNLLVATVTGLIVVFSIVPLPAWVTQLGPLGLLPVRQYLHLLAYGGLALVLGYALVDSPRPDWQILLVVFALAMLLGLCMEALQATLAHRHASARDVAMNAAGAAIAVTCWRLVLARVRLRRVEPSLESPL